MASGGTRFSGPVFVEALSLSAFPIPRGVLLRRRSRGFSSFSRALQPTSRQLLLRHWRTTCPIQRWAIVVIILVGTPNRVSASRSSSRSAESYVLCRSMKHTYRGVPSVVRALATGGRLTTYQSLILGGGSRTVPPGVIPRSRTAVVAQERHDEIQQNVACVGNKRNPTAGFAISSVLRFFVKDLDDRIFPLLGDFSCYPSIDKDVVKALRECGVVDP